MKRTILYYVFFGFCMLAVASSSCTNPNLSDGDKIFQEAQNQEKWANFFKASEYFKLAKDVYLREGNEKKANDCRIGWLQMEKITSAYSASPETVYKALKKSFPTIPEQATDFLMKKIDHITIDGNTYYFSGFMSTAENLDLSLFFSNKSNLKKMRHILPIMRSIALGKLKNNPSQPYSKPATYTAKGTLNLPRKKLPKEGTFKLWVPLPVITASQPHVKINSALPLKYIKYPASTDGDIGLLFFEIPLDQLKENLKISVKYTFTHFRQSFSINPNNIGEYDKTGPLYKQFTTSGPNIRITPEITKKAKEITGSETNVYYIARKIFDYVVEETTYSPIPHPALNSLSYPESIYVDNHLFGDCGGQSIFFCALCRSLGIPARTTGGFQMISMKNGTPSPHFWAEFYLPNYGWIPVDTSLAQTYKKFASVLSKSEQERYKYYFFGNLDSYRLVLQKDVDIPLTPAPTEPVMLPMAIQVPAVICSTMENNPYCLIEKYWKFSIKAIKEKKEPSKRIKAPRKKRNK